MTTTAFGIVTGGLPLPSVESSLFPSHKKRTNTLGFEMKAQQALPLRLGCLTGYAEPTYWAISDGVGEAQADAGCGGLGLTAKVKKEG